MELSFSIVSEMLGVFNADFCSKLSSSEFGTFSAICNYINSICVPKLNNIVIDMKICDVMCSNCWNLKFIYNYYYRNYHSMIRRELNIQLPAEKQDESFRKKVKKISS